jgi:hypothetical protein
MNAARPHVRQSGGRVTETVDLSRHQALLLALLVFVPVPLLTFGGLAVPFPELAQRVLAPLPFVGPPSASEAGRLEESRLVHALRIASSSDDVEPTATGVAPVAEAARPPGGRPQVAARTEALASPDGLADSSGRSGDADSSSAPSADDPIVDSSSSPSTSEGSSGSTEPSAGSPGPGSGTGGTSGDGGATTHATETQPPPPPAPPSPPSPPPPAPPPPTLPLPEVPIVSGVLGAVTGTDDDSSGEGSGSSGSSGSGSGSGSSGSGSSGSGGNSGRGGGNGNGNGSGSGSEKGKTKEAAESLADATAAIVGDLLGSP